MNERRKLLMGLSVGAVVGGAAWLESRKGPESLTPSPEAAQTDALVASATPEEGAVRAEAGCELPERNARSQRFPNTLVTAHDGRRYRFYEDLVRGRLLMAHLFDLEHEHHENHGSLAALARVADVLGDRLGRDAWIYSISVGAQDSPERLARAAAHHGERPGWMLLGGAPESIAEIRSAFFFVPHVGGEHGGGHEHASAHPDCSMGLIRYGNEAVGLWGSVPTRAEPAWIAHRLDWVRTRERPAGQAPRRKGPPTRA